MLKPKRMISKQEAIEILDKCDHGYLSMIDEEGNPYGVPINYFLDKGAHALYFHCSKTGKKYRALHLHPQVSFVAVAQTQIIPDRIITHYESALISGTVSFIEDEQEMRVLLGRLCERLAAGELAKRPSVIDMYINAVAIGKITIESISGKRNVDY